MTETIKPVKNVIKAVFKMLVLPPRNFTAKYSGKEDIINTKIVIKNVTNCDAIISK